MRKLQNGTIRLVLLGLLAVTFVYATPITALGKGLAAFYKGKTIKLVVPYAPGGGTDTVARLITPYIRKETGTKVVVTNMPGGETYIATNHAYHSKPNGLTIFMPPGATLTMNQLIGSPQARGIDLRKFIYLAGMAPSEPRVVILGAKSAYRSIDDLKAAKKPIKFAATALGSGENTWASLFSELLNLDSKVIIGFKGSAAIALTTMRGEVDGFTIAGATAAEFLKQPELIGLCVLAPTRYSMLPEVPTIFELVTLSPKNKELFEMLWKIEQTSKRSVVTTPGTPQERVQFLRTAFKTFLHDKELLAKGTKIGRPIEYLSGEEMQAMINKALSLPESSVSQLKYIALEKYL